MSRSYKKTPVFPIAGNKSQKDDKKRANKKFRRLTKLSCDKSKQTFENYDWYDFFDGSIERWTYSVNDFTFPKKIQEVSNVWAWSYDGKYYYADFYKKVNPDRQWKWLMK